MKGFKGSHFELQQASPSAQYRDMALHVCDHAEKNLSKFSRIGEIVAKRHIDGGLIGFPTGGQCIEQELMGRSGCLVHMGFDRPFKSIRTKQEKAEQRGDDQEGGAGHAPVLALLHQGRQPANKLLVQPRKPEPH